MDLRRLNLTRHQPGDACECANCKGKLRVQTTRINRSEGVRVRYLSCSFCEWKPADYKLVVPLEFAPPRKRA